MYGATLGYRRYNFSNLATLLAKASPLRSGDILAGIAAQSDGRLRNLRSQICRYAPFWKTISLHTNPTISPA
jgi:ethanolamine ammonia-lyase large subunit